MEGLLPGAGAAVPPPDRPEDDSVMRAVLYDAVTMASVDGLGDGGLSAAVRERSHGVAQRLGLSAELCTEVLEIVEEETGLQRTKRELFSRSSVVA